MEHNGFIAAQTEEIIMRKIIFGALVSTALGAALIAGSAAGALAAQPHQRTHTANHNAIPPVASQPFRNAHNALEQPQQPSWPYSGWSAPAGR
jgi:hypothetical protein